MGTRALRFWLPAHSSDVLKSQCSCAHLWAPVATAHFATHILDSFFQGHKPTHVFKTRIVGAD